MPIKLGSTTASSFRVGSTAVSKVYIGSTSAWTSATVPGVPTSLSGSSGNAQAVLTWTAPESDGGSAITDYAVQYSSDGGSTWSTFADGTSSSTGATVTGLDNGTAYVFRVAAVNAIGTGSYTSASSPVTPATTPGVPTSVSGTAGDEEVPLTWTAPASTGGSAITDYVVQYSSDSGSTWTTFSDGTSTSTSATVTGLTNDTAYTFRVAAVNAVGTGSYSSASAAVTPFACTQSALLLHFDGDDEDTTTTDSSVNDHAITFNGDAIISTAQSKWGGSSLLVDGSGDATVAPDGDWFNFGSGDFTIEAWIYPLSTSGVHALAAHRSSSESDLAVVLYVIDGSTHLVISTTGTSWAVNGGGSQTIAAEEWTHVALVRLGESVTVYVNGVVSQSHALSGSIYNSSEPFRIGTGVITSPNQDFDGYIDDFRVVKGLAVYQDEFDVPTGPLSACATVEPPAAP